MQETKAAKINELLKAECRRAAGTKDFRRKPECQARRQAVYRSVGIKTPGNGSLMMVHVTEY